MNHRNDTINLYEHPEFEFDCLFKDEDWEILRVLRGRGFGRTAREITSLLGGKYTYNQVSSRLRRMEDRNLVDRKNKHLPNVPGKGIIYRRIETVWMHSPKGEEYGRTWPRPSLGPKAPASSRSPSRTRKGSGNRLPVRGDAATAQRASVPRAGGEPAAQVNRKDTPQCDLFGLRG